MWVCALPEAHIVSHLFRWVAVPLVLLVILIPHCCTGGWLSVMGPLREFVRRLKPEECHMYLDGQQYICYCCFFNTIAAPVENIILYTVYVYMYLLNCT